MDDLCYCRGDEHGHDPDPASIFHLNETILARHRSLEPSGAMKQTRPVSTHTLTPLRVLRAVAPSGAEIRFAKYGDSQGAELSWYQGNLSEAEDRVFWLAIFSARKPGQDAWNRAADLLRDSGWTVEA